MLPMMPLSQPGSKTQSTVVVLQMAWLPVLTKLRSMTSNSTSFRVLPSKSDSTFSDHTDSIVCHPDSKVVLDGKLVELASGPD
eukprot:CAMPEP_0183447940 /NCGR_PEP_ID=MMETSP0370-20130417/104508_1 /TAXON_ID=268820 /ORGANISM="Peridinium aciculiferum, Strain PAER-2" /LENGTH=82 /DNA_ID=CAMNT_0025638841 /DNA_START=270 /DNA_END=518 /DNA_ORIENTATION=+